jgi:hypothetical protein
MNQLQELLNNNNNEENLPLIDFINNCINNGLTEENEILIIKLFISILQENNIESSSIKENLRNKYINEWKQSDKDKAKIFDENSDYYIKNWDENKKVHEDKHHVIVYNNYKHKITLFHVMNCKEGCHLHHHPEFSITCNSEKSKQGKGGGPNYTDGVECLFKPICRKDNLWITFLGPDPPHSVNKSEEEGFGFYRLEFDYYPKTNNS